MMKGPLVHIEQPALEVAEIKKSPLSRPDNQAPCLQFLFDKVGDLPPSVESVDSFIHRNLSNCLGQRAGVGGYGSPRIAVTSSAI